MNILLFSPVLLFPMLNSGSQIRIYNIGKYFQERGHTIHFVYYADNGMDYDSFQFMQDTWDTFTLITQNDVKARHTGNYALNERYEVHISETINSLVLKFKIDLVWVNYIFQSAFLETLPDNIFKVIDTHDIFTDRYQLFEDIEDVSYTWYSYSKEDEARALERADLIVAITQEEKDYFLSIVNTEVVAVSHLQNKQFIDRNYTSLKRIGFIGGANDVNIVAINNFLDIFYGSSDYTEHMEIVIAGSVCDHIKYDHKNLHLLGLVEDLKIFYKDIDLVVNPLLFGTGQKIKSVEALSYAIPILSTNVGFEGIKSQKKYHHLNNIDDMIDEIDKLIADSVQLTGMAEESKKVFYNYNHSVYDTINNILTQMPKVTEANILDKNFIQKYRMESKDQWVKILIETQESSISEKNAHIHKQSDWIIKQEKRIKKTEDRFERIKKAVSELATIRFIYHPLKKIKTYKKLMNIYHEIKKEGT